jgi:hypothetical protein
VVIAAFEAVRDVVAAFNRSRATTLEFSHAQMAVLSAVNSSEARAEFLGNLAMAYERGEIPTAAYQQILFTIGRLLKGSAAFTAELERVGRTTGRA